MFTVIFAFLLIKGKIQAQGLIVSMIFDFLTITIIAAAIAGK